jgi:hypothetical protein
MSVPSYTNNVRQKIMVSLDDLPPEGLAELVSFLDYMQFKFKKTYKRSTLYKPVSLGGLWKDEKISDENISEIRREMWQSLENREL